MATTKDNLEVARAVVGDTPPSALVNPSLRQEDQHMAEELQPVVVGPPAYASPDPATNQGRLVPVETHPLSGDISDDYGAAVADRTPGQPDTLTATEADAKPREEWEGEDWRNQAEKYGLSKGGSNADVQARVEDHEKALEADKEMGAKEWISEFEDADNAESLSAVKSRFDASGATFTTSQAAYDKRYQELNAGS
jgi:hypothetical protein